MNLIDFHVVSTAVICGVGIVLFVGLVAGVIIVTKDLIDKINDK